MFKELGSEVKLVISIEVPDEVIYTRITGRRSCPSCGRVYHMRFNPPAADNTCDADGTVLVQRVDDTEETLAKRLKVYHDATVVLKQYYAKREILKVVDGAASPDVVYEMIKKSL
jgi:adenylate kinase